MKIKALVLAVVVLAAASMLTTRTEAQAPEKPDTLGYRVLVAASPSSLEIQVNNRLEMVDGDYQWVLVGGIAINPGYGYFQAMALQRR